MPFIAYFFVIVLTAATAAVSLDYLTAPELPAGKQDTAKIAANTPGKNAIRQIPLGKSSRETTAQASNDDNDKSLTPVYPAAPGKNLPPPDAAADKTADAKPAEQPANDNTKPPAATQTASAAPVAQTPANESATTPPAQPVSTQALVPTPAGACAIEACASAYRSFRASDCTYQPYGGPRKMCELTSDGARQASNAPSAQDTLRGNRGAMRGTNVSVGRTGGDDLDDVVRAVRRLPGPQADYRADYDDEDGFYDRGRVVVIQREGARPYGPRYIYEAR
ncbi:MAG: BA14K family protein [Pseudolabrys sp.]|nr:BA14K family protein [Pseudolabrys sp.]